MEYDIGVHDGRALKTRPLTPDDADGIVELARRSSPEDLRLRFFSLVNLEGSALLYRLSHVDPATTVALAVFDPAGPPGEILGVIRLHHEAGGAEGELAAVVRTDLKGKGIGHDLIRLILRLAGERGLQRLIGDVLAENRVMLHLVQALGARIEPHGPSPGVVRIVFEVGAS